MILTFYKLELLELFDILNFISNYKFDNPFMYSQCKSLKNILFSSINSAKYNLIARVPGCRGGCRGAGVAAGVLRYHRKALYKGERVNK